MSEQYLSTSRLGNVIRLIGLGRQTGIFRVLRGQGSSHEEGFVQFIEGYPRRANVGQVTHLDAAMNLLANWGDCTYSFQDGAVLSNLTSQELNGFGPTSGSLPPSGSGSFPGGPFPAQPPSNTYPPQNGNYPSGYFPPQSNGYRPSTGSLNNNPPSQPYPQTGSPSQPYPQQVPPYILNRLQNLDYIPRRLTAVNLAEANMLDRRARQLLLLVDGRRSILDLVRLTRRGDEDIRYILAHLITLGLVE